MNRADMRLGTPYFYDRPTNGNGVAGLGMVFVLDLDWTYEETSTPDTPTRFAIKHGPKNNGLTLVLHIPHPETLTTETLAELAAIRVSTVQGNDYQLPSELRTQLVEKGVRRPSIFLVASKTIHGEYYTVRGERLALLNASLEYREQQKSLRARFQERIQALNPFMKVLTGKSGFFRPSENTEHVLVPLTELEKMAELISRAYPTEYTPFVPKM